MCFHSKLTTDAKSLEKRFKAKFDSADFIIQPCYNGFTFPKTPVITNQNLNLIQLYSWGLLPSWSNDQKFRINTLNARIETLSEKPSYKSYLNNRCLILVDAFYEWKWLDEKGKTKKQYEITLQDNSPFAIAGIYNTWTNKLTGEILNTYSIITTEAKELMAEIHNTKKRMPVILTPNNEKLWLGGNNIMQFVITEVNLKATEILQTV
jgi:putative SOS response-associated peptidase YedK